MKNFNVATKLLILILSTDYLNLLSVSGFPFPSDVFPSIVKEDFYKLMERSNESTDYNDIIVLDISVEHFNIIPEQVSLCKNLTELHANINFITQIPYDLKNLSVLNLNFNKIEKIDDEISNLSNLKELGLKNNQIKSLPSSIKSLKKLRKLNLLKNPLETISELPTSLLKLDLSEGKISCLPEQFGDLIDLTDLRLNSNFLSYLPESFDKLESLQDLNLENNLFESIPQQIYNLKNLKRLNLSKTFIKTVDPNVKKLQKLYNFEINNCQIYDLPEELCEVASLRRFNVSFNNLTKLPENIGNITYLSKLNCENNKIRELPDSIGQFSFISELICNDNDIQEINPNIGNLIYLCSIEFSRNKITKLPSTLSNCVGVNYLYLGDNKLEEFLDDCENLKRLKNLNLSKNRLSNFSTICKLKKLNTLDLSSNKIKEIPIDIGLLEELEILDLSNNLITELPKELKSCKKLKRLMLNDNKITKIPKELLNFLDNLMYFDLKRNKTFDINNYTIISENSNKNSECDNFEIQNIFDCYKTKPVYFDFDIIKNCKISSLPTNCFSEKEFSKRISDCCDIIRSNIEKFKAKKTDCKVGIIKNNDISWFILLYKNLFDSQTVEDKYKLDQNELDFLKRLLSKINLKLFSSNDGAKIKQYLENISTVNRPCTTQWIYLYERLIDEEAHDLYNLIKNDQAPEVIEIQNDLEAFIKNTISKFIGAQKLKIFTKIFLNGFAAEPIPLFGHWENCLNKYIGIDVFRIKTEYCDNNSFNKSLKIVLKAFFNEFTPELLITELHKTINKDLFFLRRVIEFINNSDFNNRSEIFECADNNVNSIIGIKREVCEYILKNMGVLIFN